MLVTITEKLHKLYKDECIIDGGDFEEIKRVTGFSRFTIWQYFSGKGNSISTADAIYKAASNIAEQRRKRIEKTEI